MNWRNIIAGIMGILTFVGIIFLTGIIILNHLPDYSLRQHQIERLSILFVSFLAASIVYNLIKGEELQEKKKIKNEEIRKLKELETVKW